MSYAKSTSISVIFVITLSSFIFRACGGNSAIDREVLPSELIGEWHLDESSKGISQRIKANIPDYEINDNNKHNKIILRADGFCKVQLVNLGSYNHPEYFEKQGEWSLTNIPYRQQLDRANNVVTIPWKPEHGHPNMRMKILEEDGELVLYHYLYRDEDVGVIVRYKKYLED